MSASAQAEWRELPELNRRFNGASALEATFLESFIERRIPHTYVPLDDPLLYDLCARCGQAAHDATPPRPEQR
jgi:hypothetical protein